MFVSYFFLWYYCSGVYLILTLTSITRDVITLHVMFLSMALSSSPPVSSTQYCLPLHCHKVNKQ